MSDPGWLAGQGDAGAITAEAEGAWSFYSAAHSDRGLPGVGAPETKMQMMVTQRIFKVIVFYHIESIFF